MLTLRTYAHAIREEEADLSFADFTAADCSKRLYASPGLAPDGEDENAPRCNPPRALGIPGARDRARTGDPHVESFENDQSSERPVEYGLVGRVHGGERQRSCTP